MPVNHASYNKIKQFADARQVTLVAVSKMQPAEKILELYELGQRDFGENYVQELVEKYEALPKDIRWHFIGHLQTNKIKFIAPFIFLIHGADSENVLKEINKQGAKLKRRIPCLLQVYISKDKNKFGFDEKELSEVIIRINEKTFENIAVSGLMGMASFTEDNTLIQSEFSQLKKIFDEHASKQTGNFNILSMGMSADYMFAVEAGSTMLRIGSLLFGSRSYNK